MDHTGRISSHPHRLTSSLGQSGSYCLKVT